MTADIPKRDRDLHRLWHRLWHRQRQRHLHRDWDMYRGLVHDDNHPQALGRRRFRLRRLAGLASIRAMPWMPGKAPKDWP